jgi:hypothetical protein
MLQEIRRDTTKEVNFRGRKVMPVVQLGHTKVDTIGFYLDDSDVPNYIVVNQFGDTLSINKSNYLQAYAVNEVPRPDFSFISAMKRIEQISPCNELFLKKGDNKSAAQIISQAGTIEPQAPFKSFPMDVAFANAVICFMIPFSIIIAIKALIKLEKLVFRVHSIWSKY